MKTVILSLVLATCDFPLTFIRMILYRGSDAVKFQSCSVRLAVCVKFVSFLYDVVIRLPRLQKIGMHLKISTWYIFYRFTYEYWDEELESNAACMSLSVPGGSLDTIATEQRCTLLSQVQVNTTNSSEECLEGLEGGIFRQSILMSPKKGCAVGIPQ